MVQAEKHAPRRRRTEPAAQNRGRSPARLLMVIALAAFVFEAGTMVIILFLPPLPGAALALLDSTLLVLFLSPVLYLFLFRPLTAQLARLRQSRAEVGRWEDVFRHVRWGIAVSTKDGERIAAVNPAFAAERGYTVDELAGLPILSLYPPESHPDILAHDEKARQTGHHTFEAVHLRKDGTSFPVLVNATAVTGPDGNLLCRLVNAQDITARKQAEAALRASEEQYRLITHTISDAIISMDETNVILFANPAVEHIFGYPPRELVGQSLTVLMSEAERDKYRAAVGSYLSTGARRINWRAVRVAGRRKDGSTVPLEISFNESTRRGTRIFTGVVRDISARAQAEAALRQSLDETAHNQRRLRALAMRLTEAEEAERQRLARQLHDRVGQELSVLGITLNIIRDGLPANGSSRARAGLNDAQALLEEVTERIRNVMAELRPAVLDDYGLMAALRWYGERLATRTGLQITVRGTDPHPRPPARIESALFRIAQEALVNIIKHAQANRVEVELLEAGHSLCLTVADDGIGFDASLPSGPSRPHGWGLLTITERAEAVGGSCQIISRPGSGTSIIVTAPR
ncbi:MAG: PAS domain S-box protein [Anaerolineae bacterium]